MKKNLIKQKIEEDPTIGVFHSFDSPDLTEMFGYSGFEFIVLDAEHGNLYPGGCEHLIRAAECSNMTPFVRIPSFERADILKALDRGAMGVLVPMVETKKEAEKIVSLAKYYPLGKRGLAVATRAGGYGKTTTLKAHLATSNSETMVLLQIETKKAVENLEEILTVDGVDLIFIGPSDLSQSLGLPGEISHPQVQKTIEYIIEKTLASGKQVGIFEGNLDAVGKWIDKGIKLIACGAPGIIGKAMTEYIEAFNKIISEK